MSFDAPKILKIPSSSEPEYPFITEVLVLCSKVWRFYIDIKHSYIALHLLLFQCRIFLCCHFMLSCWTLAKIANLVLLYVKLEEENGKWYLINYIKDLNRQLLWEMIYPWHIGQVHENHFFIFLLLLHCLWCVNPDFLPLS